MSVDSGWGRLTWGQAGWNDATVLTTGFGAKSWNDGAWGDLSNDQANLVGQQADTSLGTITLDVVSIAEPTGQEATGNVGTPVLDLTSVISLTGVETNTATGSFDLDDVTAGLVTSALSASVGTVDAQNVFPLTGQEAQSQLGSPEVDGEIVVSITGQQADFATPVLEYSGTLVGWGRDAWGDLSWGDSTNKIVDLVGLQASVSLGQVTEIVSTVLNGQEATTNLGSINFVISPTQALDGQEATASQGDPTLEFAYTLSSQVGTTSLGTAVTEIGVPVTGLESTTSVGSIEVGSVELVNVTGVAATSSVGSIEYELTQAITGQTATTANGSFDIEDVVQGLITEANTASLGILGIQHFQNLPTGSNTSYSNVAAGANSSITGVDTGSNTSYSDASTGSNSSISDVASGSNTSYTDAA